MLLSKQLDAISKEAESISSAPEFSSYRAHALEVVAKLKGKLSSALASRSREVRDSNLFQVEIGIIWLSRERGHIRLAQASLSDARFTALSNATTFYSKRIGLGVTPLPFFSEHYFSTGSFSYYREPVALRLSNDHYVLSAAYVDEPFFWPLIVHEIAHCWLSKRDDVDQLTSKWVDRCGLDRDNMMSRVEEAICDVVASRLIGPSYPLAFINKFWSRFPIPGVVSPDYPTNRFRLECMASSLDAQFFTEEAAEIREIADAKFIDTWREEEISPALSDICAVATTFPSLTVSEIRRLGNGPLESVALSSANAVAALFYGAWISIDRLGQDMNDTIAQISKILVRKLEGSAVSSNSQA